jgi:DoxX-like family
MQPTKTQFWLGRAITTLPILFLLFDGTIKVLNIPAVDKSFKDLGFSRNLALELGILQLVLIALYLVPRTAILGAVLWTGYLGGAIATHLRLDQPLFTHTLFPIYVAVPLWLGLWLRDARLRASLAARA